MLAIIGGGALGVLTSGSILHSSHADNLPAVAPSVTVELSADGHHYVFRSVDKDRDAVAISPDGQWIAFRSNGSREPMYVRPLSEEGMHEIASFLESVNLDLMAKELSGQDGHVLDQILVEVQRRDHFDASLVHGTEGAVQPAVSPDGRYVAFETRVWNTIGLTRE